MRKKKLMRACMSLMLACSLTLGSAALVSAEGQTEPGIPSQEILQQNSDGQSQRMQDSNLTEKDGSELRNLAEQEEEKELTSDVDSTAGPGGEDISAGLNADGKEDLKDTDSDSDQDMQEEDEDGEKKDNPEEDPNETPYSEILSDEDLVIVTVEQNGGPASEECAVETVEELSETEIEALEVYIEGQGYTVTAEAMLAAAPTVAIRTITFNMNGFISMSAEGYGSGYDAMFYVDASNCKGNGNAFCIDPSLQAPGHNIQGIKKSYTTTVRDYTDPMLVKIMYYGFGGLGDITASHANGGPARHILTHMVATRRAAELGIPGAGDYRYRANQYAISKADALYNAIRSMPDIIGRVSVLTPVSGQQTIMLLADFSIPPKEEKPVLTELIVKKYVSGTGGNKETEFHFELVITGKDGKTDKKTFTLQHGQEFRLKDLPVGSSYTVKELDGESLGYTVKAEHASGTLNKEPTEVIFRNSKEMIVPTGADLNTGSMAEMLLIGISLLFIQLAAKTVRKKIG